MAERKKKVSLEDYKIMFVIYTPWVGHNPKRMEEIQSKGKLNNVSVITVTPSDYKEKLAGLVADTIHLVQLTPDTTTPADLTTAFFTELSSLVEIIEGIKYHNI